MNPLFTTNQSASNYLNSLQTKKASPFNLNSNVTTTPSAPNATSPIASQPKTQVQGTNPVVNQPTETTRPLSSNSAYLKYITGTGDTGLTEAQVKSNLASYYAKNPQSTQIATPAPKTSQEKYLESLKSANTPSDEEMQQRTNLADINSKIFGTRTEGLGKAQGLFDAQGMLKSGAQEASTRSALRTNNELAQLAIQQNAAANSLNALTGNRSAQLEALKPVQIGTDYYDPTTGEKLYTDASKNDYITLSDGATLFDPKTGKIVANNPKDTTASSGTYTEGTNPAADAWIARINSGNATIKDVPAALKNTVIQGVSNNANKDVSEPLSVVNDLLNTGTNAITGVGQNIGNFLGLANQGTIAKYNQLKSLLSLENRQKLKGSGAISDYESRTLSSAATALDRSLSNEDFTKELKKIRGVLASANGQPVTVKVTDPATGKMKTGDLTKTEINDAINQGYVIEYQ